MNLKDIFSFGKKIWDNGGKDAFCEAINSNQSNQSSRKSKLKNDVEDAQIIDDGEISEKMTDEQEKKFIKNAQTSIIASDDVKDLFTTLYDKTLDTIKFCEVQETKRTAIREQSKQNIEKIRATRDLIITYLDKSFDERKYLFSKQFEILDKAIASNNSKLMTECLNSINTLAVSSPFKALSDANEFKKLLDSGQTEFDL